MIAGVHPAVAAELRVTNDGADSATCGSQVRPYRSISQAIENASDGGHDRGGLCLATEGDKPMSDLTAIRACDVLNQATPKPFAPIVDSEIMASCKSCYTVIPLDKCPISQSIETVYRCGNCSAALVEIGKLPPLGTSPPRGGRRLGDFFIRNHAELRYRGVLVPNIPDALNQKR